MAAARNATEVPRSNKDESADTKQEFAQGRLWWSLSPSGDRITICLPEDSVLGDQSPPSSASPRSLCDCCVLFRKDICDTAAAGRYCQLPDACEQVNLENCTSEVLKELDCAQKNENLFDSSTYGDSSNPISSDNYSPRICNERCETYCCGSPRFHCKDSDCAAVIQCHRNSAKNLVCSSRSDHGDTDRQIHVRGHSFNHYPTSRNLDSFHKYCSSYDVLHKNCTRYVQHQCHRKLSDCKEKLGSKRNVRPIVNRDDSFSDNVHNSWSSNEQSVETNSTLTLDSQKTTCENATVQASLKFEGDRPILSSPQFLLRGPELQDSMEAGAGNVKLSPVRPKVRFVEAPEKEFEKQPTEDESFIISEALVHNENTSSSSQELGSPEDIKEGIDNTLKEIYELRKLLAELKHEKLGLNIPQENFKLEEEFQFQPDEICPSSTPVDNSSRESIDDLQNLLAGMSSPKNSASTKFTTDQLPPGIPLGQRVANGEAGHTTRVEDSQSGVESSESSAQSMSDHLAEGQTDPAILSLVVTSSTTSEPALLNSRERSIQLEGEREISEVLPKPVAAPKKKIVLKSASSNRLQVPEFEPNRRVVIQQPEQSSSHFNWSSTSPSGLGEELTAQFKNQSNSSESESLPTDADESVSKKLIEYSRPLSKHSVRFSIKSTSGDHVHQPNRPPSRRSVRSAVKSNDISNQKENLFSSIETPSKLSGEQSTDNISLLNKLVESNRKSSAQSVRDFSSATHLYEPVCGSSIIIPINDGGVQYPYPEKNFVPKSLPQSPHTADNVRPESRSSVIVTDKPSSELKSPLSRTSSVTVIDTPKNERAESESRSSITVLEQTISPRKLNHFRSSSVTELPRIVRNRDGLSSAHSTRSIKSITHRYTPDLKPAIRVINATLQNKSKRDTISVKSVSFKLKNKPKNFVRSISDEESSDSETETVFLVPLKGAEPDDRLEVPTSATDHQTQLSASILEDNSYKEQNENSLWSVQVLNDKPKNGNSDETPSHTVSVKSDYRSKASLSVGIKDKTIPVDPSNEPTTSGNEANQENDPLMQWKTGKVEKQTTSKQKNVGESDTLQSIPLNFSENSSKLSFKPASAAPKRQIFNRKKSGTISARITEDEKRSIHTSKRNFPRVKSNLSENRVSLKRNRSGFSANRLNVNRKETSKPENQLNLHKNHGNRTDSRQSLNKSSLSRSESRLSVNHPRDSRANSRLSLNKTPISRSNSRASLSRARRTDSRLSLNKARDDISLPRTRAVSSSPQPSIGSIRRKRARKISLENITKRSENRIRERSLSRAREQNQNQIKRDNPKPASSKSSPKVPSIARIKRRGLVTAPVLTQSKARTPISHRSVSSYSHRPRSFRKTSPSPERYKRNISKSARGRSPVTNRSSTARKSRSRSVRPARHSPKKSLTRSHSNLSMKEPSKKRETNRARSLSTRRKSNPKKYELKVECEPAELVRKSSFNLDLVKNVKNKLKQVPPNTGSQASSNVNSHNYFGISSNALTSQLSQNAYRPLDSHFEENILLGEPYTSRGGLPVRRGITGNLQAFSRPQQSSFQKLQGFNNHTMVQRSAQFDRTGGRRYQPNRMGLGAWFRKWNPFRNLFGGSRPYPMHIRSKQNYGYERSREFENLVPRKHPMSKANSSQQLFIQDPSNNGKILIAEEVGLVYGDPRVILKKEKKKTEVAKSFLASLRKSSQDKKAALEAAAETTKERKNKKPIAKSRERKSKLGFNLKTTDSVGRKTTKSRLGFARRKESAKSVKSAKPKKKKKVRLSLSDIAKRVQQSSRMSSSSSSGKRAKFATEGKLSGLGSVAKTALKNKNIFTKRTTNLGPDGTPKSILRGPPTQQYPTDPTAVRPVHFRPGTIPAVNEIPRYAQESPQPHVRAPLPPQPNRVRLDAMATNTTTNEGRGQFFGRLHSGATRRQAEESGAHYGSSSRPPSKVPVPSMQGVGGRQFPLVLPSLQRAPRPNPTQRSAAGDTAIEMPSVSQRQSVTRKCTKPLRRRRRRVSEHVHRNYLKMRQLESVSITVTPPDQEQNVSLASEAQKHQVPTELPDDPECEEELQIAIDLRSDGNKEHQAGSPPRQSAAEDVRMDSGGPGPPLLGGGKREPKVPIVLMQGVFNRAAANTSLGRRAALEVEQLPLPPFMVEPTSMLRGALPVLPPSFASLCLCLNVCIPGLGTMVSGWLGLCVGRNRLAPEETPRTRGMSVLITTGTGLAQLAAVSFFLVGWFWSIAWGLLLVSISQKYLTYIDDHAKTMQGAVGLEMMSVNAKAPDRLGS